MINCAICGEKDLTEHYELKDGRTACFDCYLDEGN